MGRQPVMQQQLTIIIAPVGLQPALLVLLQTQTGYEPIVCTTTAERLSPALHPHLLIYVMGKETTGAAVQAVRMMWPQVGLLVLATKPEQQAIARAAGADVVLLLGISVQSLLEAVTQLC